MPVILTMLPAVAEVNFKKQMLEIQKKQVLSFGWGNPLQWEMATHSRMPGKFHGQRSMAGYNPWGCKESKITKRACTSYKSTTRHI